ncbi:PP2C family protein-serine/threonine phosphatase [Georgenia yuyongxinii]
MATDAGHRSVNEDAALAHPPVFAVADGMGGHARGDMASRCAVDALREVARRAAAPLTAADVTAALTRAAEQIQATMATEAGADAVAGTTVAGAVRTEHGGEPAWLVLNVGDSRVYRLRGTTFEQVSVDHSLVQEMVDAGTLDPAAARTHPRRNIITRAVGTDREVEPDFFMLPAHPGDRLLLCTDGLVGSSRTTRSPACCSRRRIPPRRRQPWWPAPWPPARRTTSPSSSWTPATTRPTRPTTRPTRPTTRPTRPGTPRRGTPPSGTPASGTTPRRGTDACPAVRRPAHLADPGW